MNEQTKGHLNGSGPLIAVPASPIWQRMDDRGEDAKIRYDALAGELKAALMREAALVAEKESLSHRQAVLTQEFEHRFINSLQMITSLLRMQSRATSSDEAATQLSKAARRVDALGRVHRQLHMLDHQDRVDFKYYLQNLCLDLSDLIFERGASPGAGITVESVAGDIPTSCAIPLGFIVNELVTNAAKYAKGRIQVQFEAPSPTERVLSVLDDGAGLPAGFKVSDSKGLGMKIVQALVNQIGGEMQIAGCRRGAYFKITFVLPNSGKLTSHNGTVSLLDSTVVSSLSG